MNEWLKDETRRLIALYRERPGLYDHNHNDYLKKNRRLQLLQEIKEGLTDVKPGITVGAIKKKLKTLHNQISREMIKMRLSVNTGMGSEVYSPTLWCFHDLEFLANVKEVKGMTNDTANDAAILTILNSDSTPEADPLANYLPGDWWSKNETRRLIALYRECPGLYDPNHSDYLKKDRRRELFQEIQEGLANVKPGITITAIKNKLKTLHNQISREMLKMREMGASEAYSPSLWCFYDLEFLANAKEVKETPNTGPGDEATNSAVILTDSDSTYDAENAIPIKKRRKHYIEMNEINFSPRERGDKEENSKCKERIFCNLLCHELKTLQYEESFDDLMIHIMQLVRDTKRKEKRYLEEAANRTIETTTSPFFKKVASSTNSLSSGGCKSRNNFPSANCSSSMSSNKLQSASCSSSTNSDILPSASSSLSNMVPLASFSSSPSNILPSTTSRNSMPSASCSSSTSINKMLSESCSSSTNSGTISNLKGAGKYNVKKNILLRTPNSNEKIAVKETEEVTF